MKYWFDTWWVRIHCPVNIDRFVRNPNGKLVCPRCGDTVTYYWQIGVLGILMAIVCWINL